MTEKDKAVQTNLFGEKVKEKKINKIEDHWINMPEYNNVNRQKPMIVAMIKFRNKEDFKKFSKLTRKHVFNDNLHWGNFKKNVRVAWYPPFDKASNYVYVDEDNEDFINDLIEHEE